MFSPSASHEVRDELSDITVDFHPVGCRMVARTSADTDTRKLLPEIRVPTLLVWGDADTRSPMSVANQMQDAIPGAKLMVIPGAGHVSNMEAPTRFNEVVREFCVSVRTA